MLATLMARTYRAQILSWDWARIVSDTEHDATSHVASGGTSECVDGCDDDGHVGVSYLGKHWDLFPSGRFYAPWSATYAWERRKDSSYAEALESVATKHEGWIESGEGDPTDVYFCRYW
jgi:hypothetical protein